jgi:hypothetical protein
MSSSRYCASDVSLRAAARCRASSLAMTSPSKKSLRAEERKRADVARARRRWIREQGWLDTSRLVLSTRVLQRDGIVMPGDPESSSPLPLPGRCWRATRTSRSAVLRVPCIWMSRDRTRRNRVFGPNAGTYRFFFNNYCGSKERKNPSV